MKSTDIFYSKSGKYVIHFLSAITSNDEKQAEAMAQRTGDIFGTDSKYKAVCKRANKFGGRKYHCKEFGGGIAFEFRTDLENFVKSSI
jgi:hypothetical protein